MTAQNTDPYTAPKSKISDLTNNEYGEAKFLSFSGRIGRIRYLAYSMGLMFILSLAFGLLAGLSAPVLQNQGEHLSGGFAGIFTVVVYGVTLVGTFVLAIRRLNDFNATGWLSLLLAIPIVNGIFGIALWLIPGTDGANKYGLQPPPNSRVVTFIAFLLPITALIGIIAAIAIPYYQQYVHQ